MAKRKKEGLCPCGSGKKYEDCCLEKHYFTDRRQELRAAHEELKKEINKRSFHSKEALQAFTDDFMQRKNREPNPDFLGLSADQVHRMLYFPLALTSDIVQINEDLPLETFQSIPVVRKSVRFLKAFSQEEPLRMTAKGNLPREFARKLFEELDDSEWKKFIRFRSEEDSLQVHSLRHLLKMGGWIKKEKRYFKLTARGKKAVKNGLSSEHYIRLLRTFALKFNWAFQDGYLYFWIIQQGFLFSLFLLHKKARNFIEDISLSPYFVRAFPGIFKEFGPKKSEVEAIKEYYRQVSRCFSVRFLERFCAYFGLIDARKKEIGPLPSNLIVKTSDFFDNFFLWKV